MSAFAQRLQAAQRRLCEAALAAGRDPDGITLVAVSKGFGEQCIREAHAAGQRHFGESYAQEGVAKILATADLPLQWHFIGPLQSNKTALVARHFHWVHSIDRLRVAERLAQARSPSQPPLMACIQVNISAESSKSGVVPQEALSLAQALAALPGLALRGLMAIPEPDVQFQAQRAAFRRLALLQQALVATGLPLDTLSMGMSGDFEAAIAEGATLVRLGSALFGERPSWR